jgi:hypothetical protein
MMRDPTCALPLYHDAKNIVWETMFVLFVAEEIREPAISTALMLTGVV